MYAILDIETTGGKFNEEGITEIAIYRFDGHEVVDQFISLVNPEKEIQPFVVNLTGINNQMLRTAPKFYEVAKRIVEITDGALLVAHNAKFDYRILRTEFRRLGFEFERRSLCTVDLSKKLLPDAPSYSLGKLVRSLGIPVSDRHRANGDALATVKLFKLLLAKDTDKSILKTIVREGSTGELSDRQLGMVDSIPSETGVYYLHDKDGEILFLSASKNMKKRVNQHFTNDGDKARQLQKDTKKVSYELTGNELVALLKEQTELVRNKPKYNSRRGKYITHALYTYLNEKGYLCMEIKKLEGKNNRVTTFNSLAAGKNLLRKITDDFQLCDKLNGFSEARTQCSRHTEGQCQGACVEKESPESYNTRVQEAISHYSLSGKNIVILGKGRAIGEQGIVVIKNGVLQGVGFVDLNHQINNIHILESVITPMQGNVQTHHIIDSYLRKNKGIKILELKQ